MDERSSKGFMVYLRSNESMDLYADNKISTFVNALESPLFLEGEYSCGLRSIGYHKAWGNLRKKGGIKIAVKFVLADAPQHCEKLGDPMFRTIVFNLPEGYYKNIEDVFQALISLAPPVNGIRLSDFLLLSVSDKKKKYSITIDEAYRDRVVKVRIMILDASYPPKDKSICGLINMLGLDLLGRKSTLPVSPTLQIVADISITHQQKFISPRIINFSNDYDTFFIYMPELIQDVQVGNSTAPLLQTISVGNKGIFGEYLHFEMENVNYHRCTKHTVNNISINLKDSSGELIAFKDYTGPLVLCLHFVKFNALNLELSSLVSNFQSFDQNYLYLFSSSSLEVFQTNKPWDFQTTIPSPFKVEGDWEVAVCEVKYKRPAVEIKERSQLNIAVRNTPEGDVYNYSLFFDVGTFLTPQDIIDKWNKLTIRIEGYKGPLSGVCEMKYLLGCGRLMLSLHQSPDYPIDKIFIDFAPLRNLDFAFFMGFMVRESDPVSLTLDKEEPTHLFIAPPDLQQHTYNLWVNSPGLVNETRVGARSMELLDVLPVQGEFNSVVHYVYSNRHYRLLHQSIVDIKTLRVCLKNSFGEDAPLDDKTDVMVLLHFRKFIG